jgi:ribosome recycling factor
MTQERRQELVGLVRKRMDQAHVEIRAIRHEALAALRARDPRRLVGADDVKRETARLQQITDRFTVEIDRLGRMKEATIFQV